MEGATKGVPTSWCRETGREAREERRREEENLRDSSHRCPTPVLQT